ncbi:MAG: molybdopterin-guanine dinucleotide biosynthesis protein B [Pseudomonadota bacterium]
MADASGGGRMKVWGVVGWKNAGKTTLVAGLVREIASRGLRVSTLKHTHHAVDVEREGSDTWKHRQAGAEEVMLASSARWALMREVRGAEPELEELLARMAPVDLVIAEGWKRGLQPKLEVHRVGAGRPLLAAEDPGVRIVAADGAVETDRPVIGLDDVTGAADFILRELGLA